MKNTTQIPVPKITFEPIQILERAGLDESDQVIRQIQVLGEVFAFYFANYSAVRGCPSDNEKLSEMQAYHARMVDFIMEGHEYFNEVQSVKRGY